MMMMVMAIKSIKNPEKLFFAFMQHRTLANLFFYGFDFFEKMQVPDDDDAERTTTANENSKK